MSTPATTEVDLKTQTVLKKALLASMFTMLLLVVGGVFLTKTDPTFKPRLYNFLGLNPTVRYVGKPAPNVEMVELLSGKKKQLKDYRGKVVLLDFWASWCPDCLRQLPMMQKLHKDPSYKGKVQILTVNIKDPAARNPTALKAWLARRKLTFPVLLGGMDVLKVYKVRFLPTLLIIDAKGKVIHSSPEFHREQDVRSWIQKALQNGR
jgi:thiol-disulfide isomerase/thioredoxin